MLRKIHGRKRFVDRELSWEEKNPTDYLYHESEAVRRLEETVKELRELACDESRKTTETSQKTHKL